MSMTGELPDAVEHLRHHLGRVVNGCDFCDIDRFLSRLDGIEGHEPRENLLAHLDVAQRLLRGLRDRTVLLAESSATAYSKSLQNHFDEHHAGEPGCIFCRSFRLNWDLSRIQQELDRAKRPDLAIFVGDAHMLLMEWVRREAEAEAPDDT